ncbi:MAG: formylglycine-generating enzyme family protein [Verrucomicrobia bacterium]|nr:formylglycine-generating enzyme family protein [Verrucomicrobiota bacterium]
MPDKRNGEPGARKDLTLDLGNGVTLKLVLIPAGKFLMGSPQTETGRSNDEGPQREVTISEPFHMGACEVTQAQWRAVMDTEPWLGKMSGKPGADHAASWISWNDAGKFCEALSKKTGKRVALPTEAQWEYACRAGTTTAFCCGDDPSILGEYAWFQDNTRKTGEEYAHPVGRKKPNAWGLYDMHGNVWEWCRDWNDKEYYAKAGNVDPENTTETQFRAVRGGSWHNDPSRCRAAARNSWTGPNYVHYNYGFRVMVASRP